MAERFPEIKEVKENAENENENTKKKKKERKKKHKTLFLRGRHVLYSARMREAAKCSKSSHLALRKNTFLASYYKQITT